MKRTFINPMIKDTATFIQTAAESGGTVTELEITLQPGGGNSMHYHKTYSETFTAIVGTLSVKLGKGKTLMIYPGESFSVHPLQHHCFFNPTAEEIKFNVQLHPGHEGFENAVKIVYGLAADGLTNKESVPKNLKHLALIVTMSDMNSPGLLTLLYPLFVRIAKKARKAGVEQQLIEKYCL